MAESAEDTKKTKKKKTFRYDEENHYPTSFHFISISVL